MLVIFSRLESETNQLPRLQSVWSIRPAAAPHRACLMNGMFGLEAGIRCTLRNVGLRRWHQLNDATL